MILEAAVVALALLVIAAVLYGVAGPHPPPPPSRITLPHTKAGDALFRVPNRQARQGIRTPGLAPYHRPPDLLPDDEVIQPPRQIAGRNGE